MSDINAHEPALDAAREALTGKSTDYRYEQDGNVWDTRVEPLRDRGGDIIGVIALAIDVSEQTTAQRQVFASREELRLLYAKVSNIQEDERKRISRELHDDLGQQLTALRFDAAMLRDESGESASPRIADMLSLIDNAIGSVRRVATELRPAVLDDFGFHAALEHEIALFVRRTGIQASITFDPEEPHIDIDRATTLYRIAQEALTNVARHSNAKNVHVAIEERDGWLHARISDDGRGISVDATRESPSLGLIGMRERAHAFGGTVTIETSQHGGTDVLVKLPLPPP
jgi:signal transduction histidine kinase